MTFEPQCSTLSVQLEADCPVSPHKCSFMQDFDTTARRMCVCVCYACMCVCVCVCVCVYKVCEWNISKALNMKSFGEPISANSGVLTLLKCSV